MELKLQRNNSGKWKDEILKDKVLKVSIKLEDGSEEIVDISIFDTILKTLCERYKFNVEDYYLIDESKIEIEFQSHSILADVQELYTEDEFNNLHLSLLPLDKSPPFVKSFKKFFSIVSMK